MVTSLNAYALRYNFDLVSQFTYSTRGCGTDPLPPQCNGSAALDQFEQVDRRNVYGLSGSQQRGFRLAGLDGQYIFADYGTDRI